MSLDPFVDGGHAQKVLTWIRTLPIPSAKLAKTAKELSDGIVLKQMTQYLFWGKTWEEPHDMASHKSHKHTAAVRWVIDTIHDNHGISRFAVDRWPAEVANFLFKEGVSPHEQRRILQLSRTSSTTTMIPERRGSVESRSASHSRGDSQVGDRSGIGSRGSMMGGWKPGSPWSGSEDSFDFCLINTASRGGTQSPETLDAGAPLGTGKRGKRRNVSAEGGAKEGSSSRGSAHRSDSPERQMQVVEEIMWIAKLLAFWMGGSPALPRMADLVYVGRRARERRAAKNVEKVLGELRGEEREVFDTGLVLMQAALRRARSMSTVSMANRTEELLHLTSSPRGRSPGAAQGLAPPNTPITGLQSDQLMMVAAKPLSPQRSRTAPRVGDDVDQGPLAPQQHRFVPQVFRPPWTGASCVCGMDGMLTVTSGCLLGVFDLSEAYSNTAPKPLGPEAVGLGRAHERGAIHGSKVRCMMEVHRAQAAFTTADCSILFQPMQSVHLRAATPGLSRLATRFSANVDTRLGTPPLSRFKIDPIANSSSSSTGNYRGGGIVAAGDVAGHIIVARISDGAVMCDMDSGAGPVAHVRVLQQGGGVVSVHEGGVLIVWDVRTGHAVFRGSSMRGVPMGLEEAGGWLVSCVVGSDCVETWNVEGLLASTRRHSGGGHGYAAVQQPEEIMCFSVSALSLHKNKNQLVVAAGSLSGIVRVWENLHAEPMLNFGHTKAVLCVCFAQQRIVSGGADWHARVWDCRESGKCLQILVGHRSEVTSVLCEDLRVLTGSRDGEVRMWHLTTGACTHSLRSDQVPPEVITKITVMYNKFQSHVLAVVTCTKEGTVTLWLPPDEEKREQDDVTDIYGLKHHKKAIQQPKRTKVAVTGDRGTRASAVRSMYARKIAQLASGPSPSFASLSPEPQQTRSLSPVRQKSWPSPLPPVAPHSIEAGTGRGSPTKLRWSFGSRMPRVTPDMLSMRSLHNDDDIFAVAERRAQNAVWRELKEQPSVDKHHMLPQV